MPDEPVPPVLSGWQWLAYKAMQWILPSLVAAVVAYLASLPAKEKATAAYDRSEKVEQLAHENKAAITKIRPMVGLPPE